MLSEAKLLRYGKQITAMRQKLREYGQTLPILPEELSGNSDMQKYIEKLAIFKFFQIFNLLSMNKTYKKY